MFLKKTQLISNECPKQFSHKKEMIKDAKKSFLGSHLQQPALQGWRQKENLLFPNDYTAFCNSGKRDSPWDEEKTKSCNWQHLSKGKGRKSMWLHFSMPSLRNCLKAASKKNFDFFHISVCLMNLFKLNYIFLTWCKAKSQALNRNEKKKKRKLDSAHK